MRFYQNIIYSTIFLSLFFHLPLNAQFADASVMEDGQWHELSIEESGMYKITYGMLSEMGLSPETLNPEQLKIYGFGEELPQANHAPRPSDLPEIAIHIIGSRDGSFDLEDYILFYARGPHSHTSKNPFSNKAFYYLCYSDAQGLRAANYDLPSNTIDRDITTFQEKIWLEPEEENLLNSGREWYSLPFGLDNTLSYSLDMPGLLAGTASLALQALGRSRGNGAFDISVNGVSVGSLPYESTNIDTYSIWGDLVNGNFSAELPASNRLDIELTFTRNASSDRGYLDFLYLEVPRFLQLYGSQTEFSYTGQSGTNNRFIIAETSSSSWCWEITDPYRPSIPTLQETNGQLSFVYEGLGFEQRFVVFDPELLQLPTWEGSLENQNLHALQPSNLVIITAPTFLNQAQQLAEFRANHDGLSTQLVEANAVYREFGSGQASPTALRDFIRMLYLRNSGGEQELRYVLLFGEATYDYLGKKFENANAIPIYQSYNSIHPLLSYSSDDYFGFMDEDEGEWVESGVGLNSHLLDIGIGRLPANTVDEAQAFVDKIIGYDSNLEAQGVWRQRLVFSADDGDRSTHQRDADSLARMTERRYPAYHAQRLFVDDYEQVNIGSGKRSPEAKRAVERAIDKGALVFNFTGHGSETGWTSEGIMDNPMAIGLQNKEKLPLFVTATCEFGRYDNPSRDSGAELLLKNQNGGAIALVTTTRPVISFSNFRANRAFYDACFQPIDGEMPRLGDIIRLTKNNSLNGVNNRNFALLGDPSMRLAYPRSEIQATTINSTEVNEQSLMGSIPALKQSNVQASVLSGGAVDTGFNGWATITIYDSPSEQQTIGDGEENQRMTYNAYTNKIFEGVVPVENGRMSANFVVPKDIAYTRDNGRGKIIFYAHHQNENRDAQGVVEVWFGQTEDVQDLEPPALEGWLESENFQAGDEVSRQPLLYLRVTDASGINITGRGVGHNISAVIDNDPNLTYDLNDYFVLDTGRFDSGELFFPIPEQLEVGEHTLRLEAYDTHNNAGVLELPFKVRQKISLSNVRAFPNPFEEELNINLTQDRVGDNLEITLTLYRRDGATLGVYKQTVFNASNAISLRWDGLQEAGAQLRQGLYFARIRLQSQSDGEVSEAVLRVVKQ